MMWAAGPVVASSAISGTLPYHLTLCEISGMGYSFNPVLPLPALDQDDSVQTELEAGLRGLQGVKEEKREEVDLFPDLGLSLLTEESNIITLDSLYEACQEADLSASQSSAERVVSVFERSLLEEEGVVEEKGVETGAEKGWEDEGEMGWVEKVEMEMEEKGEEQGEEEWDIPEEVEMNPFANCPPPIRPTPIYPDNIDKTERKERRKRCHSIANTAGPQPSKFAFGYASYSKRKEELAAVPGKLDKKRAQATRLADQWEKKKKAMSLNGWGEVAITVAAIHANNAILRRVPELVELYEMVNIQSVMVRGHEAIPDVRVLDVDRGPWLDDQVRRHREMAKKSFGGSHSTGRLSQHKTLDFLTFNMQKELVKKNGKIKNKAALDRKIKNLADRWERRKKSITYQSISLLFDFIAVLEVRKPGLFYRKEMEELRTLLNRQSVSLRGVPLGKF